MAISKILDKAEHTMTTATVQSDDFGFKFRRTRISPQHYGPVYIPEYQRVLGAHVREGTVNVLEWGSGLTTQIMARHLERLPGVELFLTIDEDPVFQRAIFAKRARPAFLKDVTMELRGSCHSPADPALNYSTFPLSFGRKFDFIFIDGRRRMECAFMAALLSHENTTIVLHDYRRYRYQPVTALFDIVEDGPEFRVMRPRAEIVAAMPPALPAILERMHLPGI
jgi:hypothetical protein